VSINKNAQPARPFGEGIAYLLISYLDFGLPKLTTSL
jgi:hypothetical protein